MQMKRKHKILVALVLIILIIIITEASSFALTPDKINGSVGSNVDIDLEFMQKLAGTIRIIGIFLAVGVMMIIGMKYMMGTIEEKANYKKSMMPYVIGCFLLFGASVFAPMIIQVFTDVGNDVDSVETVGNRIIGIIQVLGSFIAVGMMMILGIKYMMGSTEDRAAYKKTMVAYIVGALLIFAAVNLTAVIYNLVPKEMNSDTGLKDGTSYIQSITKGYEELSDEDKQKVKEAVIKKRDEAREKRTKASEKDMESDEFQYWQKYTFQLDEWLNTYNK